MVAKKATKKPATKGVKATKPVKKAEVKKPACNCCADCKCDCCKSTKVRQIIVLLLIIIATVITTLVVSGRCPCNRRHPGAPFGKKAPCPHMQATNK